MDRRIPAVALAFFFAAAGARALPEHKPVDSTYENDVRDKYDNNIERITHDLPSELRGQVLDRFNGIHESLRPYAADFVLAAGNANLDQGAFGRRFGPIIAQLESGNPEALVGLMSGFQNIHSLLRQRSLDSTRKTGVDELGNGSEMFRLPLSNEFVERQAESRPEDPGLQLYRGWDLFDEGDYEAARPKLDKAVSAGFKHPQVLYMRGVSNYHTGRLGQAHADAREALKRDPGNEKAQALFRLTRGRASGAGDTREEVRVAGQGAGPAGARAASGPEETEGSPRDEAEPRRPAGAVEPAPSAIAQSAELTKEALTALRVTDAATALRKASLAIDLDPQNASARRVRANVHLQRRDFPAALRDAERAVALAPGDGASLNVRALAYNRSGRFELGLKDAAAAVAGNPADGAGYFNRAYANAGLSRRGEMLSDLRSAAESNPAYRPKLAAALQLTDGQDTLFLFDDLLTLHAPAPASAGRPEPSGARTALMMLLCLAGGGALVLVVLRLLGPRKEAGLAELFGLPRREPEVQTAPGQPAGLSERYRCVRKLASGGMGVVYEAVDKNLDRRVAVKRMREEIRRDKEERARFLAEARTVAKLRHENIVSIHSIEEQGEEAYLVFEFVEGRTLHDILEQHGSLSPRQARELFRGVCAALEHAHRHGIVHRDLKPANVMIDHEGTVKVMDFGVARQARDALDGLALTNTVLGTPPYMAPEQEEGVVRPEIDTYALGVCLYETLTGKRPFEGTAGAVTLKKSRGEFAPPSRLDPELPRALDAFMSRALNPDPERRFRSPSDFLAALEPALAQAVAS